MIQFRRPWKASIMTRNQKQKGIVRMQRNGGEALTMIFHCSTQLTADIIIKPQHFIFSSGEGSLQYQYAIYNMGHWCCYLLLITIVYKKSLDIAKLHLNNARDKTWEAVSGVGRNLDVRSIVMCKSKTPQSWMASYKPDRLNTRLAEKRIKSVWCVKSCGL